MTVYFVIAAAVWLVPAALLLVVLLLANARRQGPEPVQATPETDGRPPA